MTRPGIVSVFAGLAGFAALTAGTVVPEPAGACSYMCARGVALLGAPTVKALDGDKVAHESFEGASLEILEDGAVTSIVLNGWAMFLDPADEITTASVILPLAVAVGCGVCTFADEDCPEPTDDPREGAYVVRSVSDGVSMKIGAQVQIGEDDVLLDYVDHDGNRWQVEWPRE